MKTRKFTKLAVGMVALATVAVLVFSGEAFAATYNISGSVTVGSYGPGVSGVSVTADGDYSSGYDSGSATTSSSGSYTIYSLNPGRYTVRASKSGYSISPSSQSVTLSYGNGSADFTTPGFYIDGYVKYDTGKAISGANITATYPAGSTTTNSSGYYKISGLADKMYNVTVSYNSASLSDYANINGGNDTVNFTYPTYYVDGYVRYDEDGDYLGVSGVSVTCGTSSTTTGSSGYYKITGLYHNTWYDVQPSKGGYTISPTTGRFYTFTSNQSEHFTVTSPSISGSLKYDNGTAIGGAEVNVGGYTVTTNGSGNYTLKGCVPGSWYIIPPTGYIWNPTRIDFTLSDSSPYLTGKNFTAQTFTISGYVKHGDGTAIPGAVVTVPGYSSVTTDASGYYSRSGIIKGIYNVTASYLDYPFSPLQVTIDSADITNADLYTYLIKGYIRRYGSSAGVNGIKVNIKKDSVLVDTVTTQDGPAGAGYYEKKIGGGTYTIEAANP